MEIFPGVHRIESVFGGRALYQYLFLGDRTLLIDAGIATTPDETILPYLETLREGRRDVSILLITHPDLDHHGGVPGIKNAFPDTMLACGREDAALIEDAEALYQDRYNFLAHHGLGFGREAMSLCPETRTMDALFSGGEVIDLAPDWRLRLWRVPGHSAGHLAIYDERHRAAFTSDAVQGGGYPLIDGGMAFGPTYYTVSAYLATIRFLEEQAIEHLFGGHWPAMHDIEVAAFLDESRRFVERADDLLARFLSDHPRGVSLGEILAALSPRLGDWPNSAGPFLQFALYGHVERLREQGRVIAAAGNATTYRLA